MLASDHPAEVGSFAAYACQTHNLDVLPWQTVPETFTISKARWPSHTVRTVVIARPPSFLQRMLKLGLSRYEPDPIRACEAAERKAAS